ncbi:hypothetical protein SAMN02745121_06899, partial [Nannocystis exedens]
YLWLRNPERMSKEVWDDFEALRTSSLRTARAWALKEAAMEVWEHTSPSNMRDQWGMWYDWAIRSRLEPMKAAARMVKNHLGGIIHAATERITNASAEGDRPRDPRLRHRRRGDRDLDRRRREDGPLTVTAGYRGQADPGAWGNKISVDIVYRAAGQPDVAASFDITVKYDGRQVEFWDHLPPGPGAVAKVNDEFSGSKYITIAFDPAVNGGVLVGESLTLGSGAQDSPDADALEDLCIAALGLYDTIDIQLLACPDCTTVDFAVAGTDYCALRGDCIFVTDAGDVDVSGAQAFTPTLRGNNIYGAVYWPYIRVNDPIGTSRWVPATGHVLGVMARTERERGVWKAPAGVAARVQGALDVRHHISDPAHTTLVKGSGVNAVRFISGQGIVVDSARTLSTNSLWQFINVRLLFNFVKSSLKNGLRWVVYEPNDEVLWNKVKHNAVTPFLMSLWRRGAFGPGSPEDVFSVKCDGENNPSNNVQAGILNVEVYFYPSRPAETFIITVGQQEGGPTASEG